MEMIAKMIGNIIMDIVPDADNPYEAIDRYCATLYKRIMLKDKSGIDYEQDRELYLFLCGYKSKIAEMVYKQTLKNMRGSND